LEPKFSIPEIASIMGITRQGIHKKLRERNIKSKKTSKISYLTFSESKDFFDFKFKPLVVTIHIVKGGVGKTTLAVSIGVRASLYGARTLLIDVDPQFNLTETFDIDPYKHPVLIDIINDNKSFTECIVNVLPGIDILPSRIENITLDTAMVLKRQSLDNVFSKHINQLKKSYDLILFDCPPAIGESVTASILASDLIISPIIPAKYATKALKIVINEINTIKESYRKDIDMKILLNDFDNRKNKSHTTLSNIMANKVYRKLMFQSFVRTSQTFENVLDDDLTIFDTTKWTTEKEDIDLITRELLGIQF